MVPLKRAVPRGHGEGLSVTLAKIDSRPNLLPSPGVGRAGFLLAVILSDHLWIYVVSFNWLGFIMFPGLGREKDLSGPFVFKMFPGLGARGVVGHRVAMQSGGAEARKICIINSFLLRARGAQVPNRTRSSARLLPVRVAPRVSPGLNAAKA